MKYLIGRPLLYMAPQQVVSGCSTDLKDAPGFLTKCVLDIDIYKNRPSVHEHVKQPNPEVRARLACYAVACSPPRLLLFMLNGLSRLPQKMVHVFQQSG